MNHAIRRTLLALVCAALPLAAQTDLKGHWTGALATPGGALTFEIDLDQAAGAWIGSFSVPDQGAMGLPLDQISFTGGKAAFTFKGAPGAPAFSGTLSPDGKILDGSFSQGQMNLPMKLAKTGPPKVELPKASPVVGPEFVGTWQGTIEAGQPLRIVLKISNSANGAEAEMVSPDQGNAKIPVSSVTQQGTKLKLDVRAVGGGFEGEINKEGSEINGTWTQLGNSIGLKLTKSAGTN